MNRILRHSIDLILDSLVAEHVEAGLIKKGGQKKVRLNDGELFVEYPSQFWGQTHRFYTVGSLEIVNWRTADGICQNTVTFKGEMVYVDDSYDGSDSYIVCYKPGEWETIFDEILKRFPSK
jgi:hypothetical protein